MLILIIIILFLCLIILSWIFYLTEKLIKVDVNTNMTEMFIARFIADYTTEHPDKNDFLLGWLDEKDKDA